MHTSHMRVMSLALLLTLLFSACAPAEAWLTIDAVEGEQPTPVVEIELAEEVNDEAGDEADAEQTTASAPESVLLIWQGALADGSCGQVTVDAGAGSEPVGRVGVCNSDEAGIEWLPIHQTEWEQIFAHFGTLDYLWGDETLTLHGQGQVTGTVWAEAMGVWARFVYMETEAGRSGSASRTALSWQVTALDEIHNNDIHNDDPAADATDEAENEAENEAEMCGRVTVMRYGYAYAMQEPCTNSEAGRAADLLAEGWLTTGEMETVVEWLRNWAPLYAENGYVDGQGDGETGASEIEQVAEWSAALFGRLQTE